jgi:nicotinamide-nucleotide amidase
MNAHIITIGDEILIGQTMNTNAASIGSYLAENQINVRSTSVVGDNEEDILNEFERCWNENDLIVTTGGLGPTHDDLTLPCIVKFFNTELALDKEVLEDIKKFSEKRGRKITKINEGQAMVPKISKTIRNHIGTAPGVWIEKENKIFVVLPGVPFEMEEMMHSFVIPSLIEKRKELKSFTLRKTLKTTGLPESTLFERLGNLDELLGDARLAFLPDQYGVKLRITATEESEELAKNKILEIEQKIRNKAGRYIYSTKDESLEEVIARLINERGLKIAVAESCTGGNVSNFLTNVSGSSKYFERGIVSYSNAAKVELLRVNEDILAEHGAVSLEVARQMAEGVKSTSGADLGLSLTGIMGPTGATTGKPVGLVYIGLCDDKVCTAKKFQFGENRLLNKQRATQAALDLVRKYLLGISLDD